MAFILKSYVGYIFLGAAALEIVDDFIRGPLIDSFGSDAHGQHTTPASTRWG
jgi:hypothetical protein